MVKSLNSLNLFLLGILLRFFTPLFFLFFLFSTLFLEFYHVTPINWPSTHVYIPPFFITCCYSQGSVDVNEATIINPNSKPKIAPDQGFEVMPQVLPAHSPRYPIAPPITAPTIAPIIYLINIVSTAYNLILNNRRPGVCDFYLVSLFRQL